MAYLELGIEDMLEILGPEALTNETSINLPFVAG